MGAGVKRSTGGGRHRPMGEINVTPFVDVMLVLLIVFMVTAPLLTVGVEVDLGALAALRAGLAVARVLEEADVRELCRTGRAPPPAAARSRGRT